MKFRDFIEAKGNYQQYLQRKGWGPYKPTAAGDDPLAMAGYNLFKGIQTKVLQATGGADWQPLFPKQTTGQVMSNIYPEGARFTVDVSGNDARRYSDNLLPIAIKQISAGIKKKYQELENEYNQCQGPVCPALLEKLKKWQEVSGGLNFGGSKLEETTPISTGVRVKVFVPFKQ